MVKDMTTDHAPSGTIRAALRYPDFRFLLSALAVSQVGDWLYNLALVVLVYDRTHSALGAAGRSSSRYRWPQRWPSSDGSPCWR